MMACMIHPFEVAGLGHAPFSFTGYERIEYRAAPDAPLQPGGSCDYCGTGIMDAFLVVSADGRRFKVGSDCVRKVWAEFDATIPTEFRAAVAEMEYQKREVQRRKREAKRLAAREVLRLRAAEAWHILIADPSAFTDEPHPHPYWASQGKTRRDYLAWGLDHFQEAAVVAVERRARRPEVGTC